jgi:DNA methylase
VDCVVTSPSSWRLREDTTTGSSAGHTGCPHLTSIPTTPARFGGVRRCVRCGAVRLDGQYGVDPTPAGYVETLRRVFAQVHRVLAPCGTVWVNLGDSYATNADLLGMPWRVALALQADGWILRNAIIWHTPNATPTTIRDRLARRYKLLFLLVRQPRYFFHLDPIRQHYTGERPLSRRAHHRGTKPHTATGTWPPPGATIRGRNPGDVWTIPTHPETTGHPTPTPVELPTRCIAAGCPPGGTVLDPFSGVGTTGLAARHLGRSYIGIDTNPNDHTTVLHRLGLISADGDPPTPGEKRPTPAGNPNPSTPT